MEVENVYCFVKEIEQEIKRENTERLKQIIAFEEERDISNDKNWNEAHQYGYIQALIMLTK